MKLKWRVQEKPKGRYSSFERRGWPMAEADGKTAARLTCKDDYVPKQVRSGRHGPITVLVAQWNMTDEERAKHKCGTFRWRALRHQCKTLDAAKALAQKFFDDNPEFLQ